MRQLLTRPVVSPMQMRPSKQLTLIASSPLLVPHPSLQRGPLRGGGRGRDRGASSGARGQGLRSIRRGEPAGLQGAAPAQEASGRLPMAALPTGAP